jgi:hypothetical protein
MNLESLMVVESGGVLRIIGDARNYPQNVAAESA